MSSLQQTDNSVPFVPQNNTKANTTDDMRLSHLHKCICGKACGTRVVTFFPCLMRSNTIIFVFIQIIFQFLLFSLLKRMLLALLHKSSKLVISDYFLLLLSV